MHITKISKEYVLLQTETIITSELDLITLMRVKIKIVE